ncbi:hypothetical protein ACIBEA_42295 [Streptomyces sp. NPDC051555]|uniref:hypothetical protein n=1 Tax=Streptomyces sp. NPDC051555 TaxID=3365657 RepID=UPI00378DB0C9
MNRQKIASVIAACTIPVAVLAAAGSAAATPPAPPRDCATWISGPGQTGNVTCTTGGSATTQIRAVVTCVNNAGNHFTVYGEWTYLPGASSGTCSLNGTAGVADITYSIRNRG